MWGEIYSLPGSGADSDYIILSRILLPFSIKVFAAVLHGWPACDATGRIKKRSWHLFAGGTAFAWWQRDRPAFKDLTAGFSWILAK